MAIVDIDLTKGSVTTHEFSRETALRDLGGFGFNIRYLYEHIDPAADPLGSENILLISPGLLTGTTAPSASRVHLNALSPLSGLIGSSSLGGRVGHHFRSLGISSVIVRGTAHAPVIIHIDKDGAHLDDGCGLWGMDTRQVEAAIKRKIGDVNAEVLSIGIAGENRVRYACIMAGIDHSAGHTGLGAVMGSKNLKAICVSRGKRKEKSTPEAREAAREYVAEIRQSVSRYKDYSTYGSSGDIDELNRMGLLSTRNYRTSQLEDANRIDGRNLASYVVKKITCPGCSVRCKAEVELKSGKHAGFRGGRPEYESVIDLGALCGLADPDELMYLSNLSNILGLDTISTGSVIAFAMDLYDRGIIGPDQTDGLELDWGNGEAMEAMMYKIATREGIGNVLADGVFRAARKIGNGAGRYAYHVKGVELYGADPRGMMGTALSYAVSMRGGDFTSVYPVPEFRYTADRAEREFGSREAVDRFATGGKGAMVRYCMIVSSVIDSLGICKVPALTIAGNYDLKKEARLVRLLTGLDLNTDELLHIGERIVNLEKLFNLRFGATNDLDTLPDIFLNDPLESGASSGAKVDLQPMVEDFYASMGWDTDGVPLGETLRRLGIE